MGFPQSDARNNGRFQDQEFITPHRCLATFERNSRRQRHSNVQCTRDETGTANAAPTPATTPLPSSHGVEHFPAWPGSLQMLPSSRARVWTACISAATRCGCAVWTFPVADGACSHFETNSTPNQTSRSTLHSAVTHGAAGISKWLVVAGLGENRRHAADSDEAFKPPHAPG